MEFKSETTLLEPPLSVGFRDRTNEEGTAVTAFCCKCDHPKQCQHFQSLKIKQTIRVLRLLNEEQIKS